MTNTSLSRRKWDSEREVSYSTEKKLNLVTDHYQHYYKEYLDEICGYPSNIYVNRWAGPGANTHMHTHDFFEMVVIVAGRCGYTYNGRDYEVHAGDAFIVPPGQYHQYHDQNGLDILNFLWCPDGLPLDFQKLKEMSAIRAFLDLEPDSRNAFAFEHHLVLTSEQVAEMEKLHRRMLLEEEVLRDGGQLRMTCLLYDVLILLARYYSEMGKNSKPNDILRMEQVAEYIEKNYACHLQREDAAKVFGRGVRMFSDAFNKSFGMSFSDYLTQIRLRHAQQMLVDTQMRITDIALECGFCDSNYFCAVFRKVYGITPRKYRVERTGLDE